MPEPEVEQPEYHQCEKALIENARTLEIWPGKFHAINPDSHHGRFPVNIRTYGDYLDFQKDK